jgi:hypothetical protein
MTIWTTSARRVHGGGLQDGSGTGAAKQACRLASAHGLRKAACRRCRGQLHGPPSRGVSGHASLKEVQRYTKLQIKNGLPSPRWKPAPKPREQKLANPNGKVSQNEGQQLKIKVKITMMATPAGL